MAVLRILLHGQSIGELQMQSGQEYFAGRGASCHIQLMSERGISRQHLRFAEVNGKWRVTLMSKYGDIVYQSRPGKDLDLTGNMHFSVAPYDFQFVEVPDREIEAPSFAKEALGTGTIPVPTTPATVSGQASQPALTQPSQAASNVHPEASTPSPQMSQKQFDDIEVLGVEGQSGLKPAPAASTPAEDAQSSPVNELVPVENTSSSTNSITGRTVVASSPAISAYLRIVNNKTQTEETLKLEGSHWSVGRHPKCEILLNDTAISRKHFDITRSEKGYYIIDHGSSNGTFLNGEKVPAAQPMPLISGDVLTVRHIEIKFEVRDSSYDHRALTVPNEFEEFSPNGESFSGPLSQDSVPTADINGQLASAGNIRTSGGKIKIYREKKNKKRLRIAIGGLVGLLVIGLLMPSKKAPEPANDGKTDNASMPKSLTPQQEQQATDIYNLAKNYYLQKKYILCLSQFDKLHQLVPFYKDSKQIESYCSQGKELEQIDADRERKEREKQDAENKIRAIVDDCKARAATISTSTEMTNCLQGAVELDPSNAEVNDMIMQVKVREQQAEEEKQKAANSARHRHEGEEVFVRATTAFKAGDLKKAAALFKQFTSSRYPGLGEQQARATRELASVRKSLADQLNAELSACQSLLDKGDPKGAYQNCSKVVTDNPGDAKAETLKEKAMSQLKHDMKAIYEDSVLEESLGNIESAKEKWSKIVDKSVPEDGYYQKAKSKLRKYGIGM